MRPSKRVFQEQLQDFSGLVGGEVVKNERLQGVVDDLETTGQALVGSGRLALVELAQTMHDIYTSAQMIEVNPPLSATQQVHFAGKAAIYGFIAKEI